MSNYNTTKNISQTSKNTPTSDDLANARLKFVNQYIDGDDSALEKLLILNQQAKRFGITMSDQEKRFWQERIRLNKENAADARERVGSNPEKLAQIDMIEKRVQTIQNIAANQLTEKP
ncbi:MAG: hypothetical protein EBR67_11190 [Proteobacteria bacterium]|nr:hypothetical protein [Pseudomonadota bacterium]